MRRVNYIASRYMSKLKHEQVDARGSEGPLSRAIQEFTKAWHGCASESLRWKTQWLSWANTNHNSFGRLHWSCFQCLSWRQRSEMSLLSARRYGIASSRYSVFCDPLISTSDSMGTFSLRYFPASFAFRNQRTSFNFLSLNYFFSLKNLVLAFLNASNSTYVLVTYSSSGFL